MKFNSAVVASFTYPRPNSNQVANNLPDIPKFLKDVTSQGPFNVSYGPVNYYNRPYNFSIVGLEDDTNEVRKTILRNCPIQHSNSLRLPRLDEIKVPYITSVTDFTNAIKNMMETVKSGTGAQIEVNPPLHTQHGVQIERICTIHGTEEAVGNASVKILGCIDLLYGRNAEIYNIEDTVRFYVALGCKRRALKDIQEKTSTNLYFPPPFLTSPRGHSTPVSITGLTHDVKRAREMLMNIIDNKVGCLQQPLMCEELRLDPRKIEWMINYKSERLHQIMFNNGTYIKFPCTETNSDSLYIYGDNMNNITCTVRATLRLARDFVIGSFKLKRSIYTARLPSNEKVLESIRRISCLTGAEIIFKNNTFEIYGISAEVSQAVSLLFDEDIVNMFQHHICFNIDLWTVFHEFVKGQKDGKIKAINTSTGVNITFEEGCNSICVSGTNRQVLDGLRLFEAELPSEISFNVPEKYHKYVIGLGGKTIKKLIKKHNVFLKFYNSTDFVESEDINDNAVARTPSKFASKLVDVQADVWDLVSKRIALENFMNEHRFVPQGDRTNTSGDVTGGDYLVG